MNRKQIIAELRRAAARPFSWDDCHIDAWEVAYDYIVYDLDKKGMIGLGHKSVSTLYLLVACALEDEQ